MTDRQALRRAKEQWGERGATTGPLFSPHGQGKTWLQAFTLEETEQL